MNPGGLASTSVLLTTAFEALSSYHIPRAMLGIRNAAMNKRKTVYAFLELAVHMNRMFMLFPLSILSINWKTWLGSFLTQVEHVSVFLKKSLLGK